MDMIKRFLDDESGATAIEYGLIAAGISIAIVAVVFTLGEELEGIFSNVETRLSGAGGGAGEPD